MGFDLYGLKPQKNTNEPPILLKFRDEDGWVKWDDMTESDKDEYFKFKNKYDDENPGLYFRNNVWWWRPLWEYICIKCENILTDKDIESGSYNDGHRISKTKSKRIASRLRTLIKDGSVVEHAIAYHVHLESLPLEDCGICDGSGHRNDNIVQGPCNACNTEYTKEAGIPIGKKYNWKLSYPFEIENIIGFERFCEQSGGFEIC
jgi:hypothetical protein